MEEIREWEFPFVMCPFNLLWNGSI